MFVLDTKRTLCLSVSSAVNNFCVKVTKVTNLSQLSLQMNSDASCVSMDSYKFRRGCVYANHFSQNIRCHTAANFVHYLKQILYA